MFRPQRAVLKFLSPCSGHLNRVYLLRCQSTKSAIHAALKRSGVQHENLDTGPRRPRTRLTPTQEAARSSYQKSRLAYFREREGRSSRKEEGFRRSIHDGESGNSRGRKRSEGLWKPEYENETSATTTSKASRFRLSTHNAQESHDLPEGETPLEPHGERRSGSSLSSFLPDKETFRDPDPLVLPYTTPASEFLYGRGVVTAALRAGRRKLYKLYIYQSQGRKNEEGDMQMRKMAVNLGVPVEKIGAERYRILDKMSEGRPHNVSLVSLGSLLL